MGCARTGEDSKAAGAVGGIERGEKGKGLFVLLDRWGGES